ncbi:hypothetical protein H9P43_007235 [Blastocladiella emersonii ATCC 22665]|nr:hypothetical protein H9P43_007235 [Blastocladiella emersonii ATCC 22665]
MNANGSSPPAAAAPLRLQNYINGAFVDPAGVADGKATAAPFIVAVNPSTGEPHVQVPNSDSRDIDAAVSAATAAFPSWSRTPRAARSAYLARIAAAIEARLDEFAAAESADQGKPVSLARSVDIPRAVHNFKFFASAVLHESSKANEIDGAPVHALNYVRREPVGVAALISPWNLPLYLLTWKIAPCIATGNTCVCKPSEFTSHTAYLLCTVLTEVGLPPGVVNMVFGDGPRAGAPLVAHPGVPLISFTGGTVTGARIAAMAAPMFKKLSLELGGKNAALVFADANLDRAVATCVNSAFRNQGEICLCTSRIFVHRSIYAEFVDRLVAKVKLLRVGDPRDPETNLGALVSQEHMDKVLGYIQLARDEGGEIRTGGGRVTVPGLEGGYYVAPTIVTGLSPTARCMQEEIFGPVVGITPFDDEDQAVAWANGTKYGLAACVWTENVRTAHRVAARIHAGTVWVNCWMVRSLNMPFGGVKASGTGREGWPASLEFFTEEKTVCVYLDEHRA